MFIEDLIKDPIGAILRGDGGGSGGGGVYYKCAAVNDDNTWDGYLAIIDAETGEWSFSEELTTGLIYSIITPKVGSVYDQNCMFKVSDFPLAVSPLTLTAMQDNTTVRLSGGQLGSIDLQYKIGNDGAWTPYSEEIVLQKSGDFVQFWNKTNSLSVAWNNYIKFSVNGKISASGNISSLINYESNMPDACFYSLFGSCAALVDASELKLDFDTVSNQAYYHMFYGCTNLTAAPELPAKNLGVDCYTGMFYNCTNLTAAPELPATTLAANCYTSMFNYCTKLQKAPELVATTLVSGCYNEMFRDCKVLKSLKVHFTEWTSGCTDMFLFNGSGSGTFYKPEALPDSRGNNNIPSGWTVVNF